MNERRINNMGAILLTVIFFITIAGLKDIIKTIKD